MDSVLSSAWDTFPATATEALFSNSEKITSCLLQTLDVASFIEQILGDDVRDRFLGAHEKILIWINNVKKATSPHFEEAHELLFEVKALMQSKAAAAASQPSTKLKTASKL